MFMEMLFVPFAMGSFRGSHNWALCLPPKAPVSNPNISPRCQTAQLSRDSQNAYRVPGTWLDAAEAEMAA